MLSISLLLPLLAAIILALFVVLICFKYCIVEDKSESVHRHQLRPVHKLEEGHVSSPFVTPPSSKSVDEPPRCPQPKPVVRHENACDILLFPDPKLPCKCYFSTLTGQNFRCKNDPKKIHWSKFKGCQESSSLTKMMDIMRRARRLDICVMSLTLWEMSDFLCLMKQRRMTDIRIIADGGTEFIQGTKLPMLIKKGFSVKIPPIPTKSQGKSIMHNKFCIIDSRAAIVGSLNWTQTGVLKNRESVVVIRDEEPVEMLRREFDEMWANFKDATEADFKPSTTPRL